MDGQAASEEPVPGAAGTDAHSADSPRSGFEAIERAVADLRAGKPVVVVDDEDRENEGDLIFAAEMATPELVSFMVRYTSGYVCVALRCTTPTATTSAPPSP